MISHLALLSQTYKYAKFVKKHRTFYKCPRQAAFQAGCLQYTLNNK